MKNKSIKYPVNEYFLSVQAEGSLSGTAALFIRFGKCNLQCGFCDTSPARKEYKYFSAGYMENILRKYKDKAEYLVITGGEPLLHGLEELIDKARNFGYKIAVETNGTLFQPWLKKADWITVSPKQGSRQNEQALKSASELKFVVRGKGDLKFVEKFMPFSPSYLMPVNNDPKAAGIIINYLKKSRFKSGLRLGIQMQKVYKIK